MATEAPAAEPTNGTAAEAEANTETEKEEKTSGKEVYASGLPAGYDENKFKEIFEKFCTRGTISHCRFRKHVVGTQTGYGFLTFTDEQDGKDAIKNMNGKTLEGELVKVTDSASPSYSRSKTNLYIEGLPTDWDENKVKELFEQFGEITESRVLINRKTNAKTGVGFIHFKTTEEAEKAIHGLNGSMAAESATKPLSIRFAKVMGRRRGNNRNQNRGRANYNQSFFGRPPYPHQFNPYFPPGGWGYPGAYSGYGRGSHYGTGSGYGGNW